MARSVIDTERIAGAAGQIQRLADSIQTDVQRLRGELGGLADAWQGPAKAEFDRVMTTYEQLQGKVNQSLADISTLTGKASSAYAQHEEATRALFAQ